MAGLSLRAGLGAGAGAPSGGSLTPVPGQQATGPRSSTAAAWGIGAGQGTASMTPMVGTVGGAAIATLLLLWLWWSLPR